ncbi:MAG TPA: hypothetical protein VM581_02575 [Magnetospirillaceae bacterium]|nr:hypothetical protein [Magnetospirillaceae bacterium]
MEDGSNIVSGLTDEDEVWLLEQRELSDMTSHIAHLSTCCFIAMFVNILVAIYVFRQRVQVPLSINEDAFIAPLAYWVLGANILVAIAAFTVALKQPNRLLLPRSRRLRQMVLAGSIMAICVALAM